MSLLTLLAPTPAQLQIPASLFSGTGPRFSVEVAFRSAPLANVALWEDVTAYVRGVTINRGRSGELDRFQPSTCTVTFDSTGREFDPEYAPGPWYGFILPNRRIRVRAQWDNADYFLWEGFVDEWPVDYEGLSFAVVNVPCSDAFAMLANIELADSAFAAELVSDIGSGSAPTAWFRLGEAAGSTVCVDSVGAFSGTYSGTVSFGQDSLPVGGTGSSVDFGVTGDAELSASLITGVPFTVEFFLKTNGISSGYVLSAYQTSNHKWTLLWALGTPPGYFLWELKDTSAPGIYKRWSYYGITGSGLGDDADVYHVVFTFPSGSVPRCWVNGIEYVPATGLGYDSSALNTGWPAPGLDNYTWNISHGPVDPNSTSPGIFDEFVIYNGIVLSDARIAAHAAAAAGWVGDTTAERVTQILDSIGWPDTLRDIGTGSTVVGTAWPGGRAFDAIMQMVDTENGQCYVDGRGRIVFRGRDEIDTDTRSSTSNATFGDE